MDITMKKILILALVLMSANALSLFSKDYIWLNWGGSNRGEFTKPIFSSDSKKVYANSTTGSMIFDARTGDSIDFNSGLDKMGSILAESDDGSYIINRNFEKFDNKTKELIWKCPIRDSKDFRLHFKTTSENGRYLVQFYSKEDSSTSLD